MRQRGDWRVVEVRPGVYMAEQWDRGILFWKWRPMLTMLSGGFYPRAFRDVDEALAAIEEEKKIELERKRAADFKKRQVWP